MTSGNSKLSQGLCERLEGLGKALDQKHQLRVFDGGLVGFDGETESEVLENVTRKEARSPARPREGRQARSPQQRRGEWWWPPGAPGSLSTFHELEWLGGLGAIVSAYPDTRAAIHDNHAWVAVPAMPLGMQGPLAFFVVCYPRDRRFRVRGWGFWVQGGWLTPMGTRHTNYPDQSICAFEEGTWDRKLGLTALVDRYCEWAVRQLHFRVLGRWAGMQVGPNAVYRLHEFRDGELCHCDSGARYGACCRPIDEDAVAQNADVELLASITFTGGVPLGEQSTPPIVYRIAHGNFPSPAWIDHVVPAKEKRLAEAKGSDPSWRLRFSANSSASSRALLCRGVF